MTGRRPKSSARASSRPVSSRKRRSSGKLHAQLLVEAHLADHAAGLFLSDRGPAATRLMAARPAFPNHDAVLAQCERHGLRLSPQPGSAARRPAVRDRGRLRRREAFARSRSPWAGRAPRGSRSRDRSEYGRRPFFWSTQP